MKCNMQSNDVRTQAKYSPVFKAPDTLECATYESYLKVIPWVAMYIILLTISNG